SGNQERSRYQSVWRWAECDCCVGGGVCGGARGGVVEEISAEVFGIAGGTCGGGGAVWNGRGFSRCDLSVSRRVDGGPLGASEGAADILGCGFGWLRGLPGESFLAVAFPGVGADDGVAVDGIACDFCDDWGRATAGAAGDGIYGAVDAEADPDGAVTVAGRGDDWGVRTAKWNSCWAVDDAAV